MTKNETLILLDADVIIHFIKGGQILLLPKIFKYKKVILDIVVREIEVMRNFRSDIANILQMKLIQKIEFPSETEIFREYASLKKQFGDGESASMAVCRFKKNILGSSNLKDIASYCDKHGITYLTTMDFIYEAYNKALLTEAQCDLFIYDVTSKNSKLPCTTIKEFIQKFKR